ncbi:hypothetical protein MPL1032_10214 [Mesorhizobium plurifarium]|uniref:Uncharacterized protein n=1 Tax=Mesorhizobium plurifarium TaxID=69974 RepID=A0A0K2VMP1_MESPL|nr:hypothetical protein MPL1032_10214 [Mesorhizobium plurifarium]
MNRLEVAALAAAFDQQTEGMVEGTITDQRIYEALTTGPAFSDEERRLLWLSPDVRSIYFNVRTSVDREIRLRMLEAGYGGELRLRAASDDSDVHTIRGKGYKLTLFRDRDGESEEWSISLQLDKGLHEILPPRASIRLRDGGGAVWIDGIPNNLGQISAFWRYSGETPIERAARHGLVLSN